jgi:hypothetical protein
MIRQWRETPYFMGLKLGMKKEYENLFMENPSEKMTEPKNGNNCHFLLAIFFAENISSVTPVISGHYEPSDENVS